jgi:hypothetical protein
MIAYFNYAETYVEELKNFDIKTPMLNLKAVVKKALVPSSYIEKHFGDIEYAVEDDLGVHIMLGMQEIRTFKPFSIESSWDDFTGDLCIILPDMKKDKGKALSFLRECFSKRTDQCLFGLNISSTAVITNFPFDFISVNPQQIARFKEILLPTGRRVSTKEWTKVVAQTKALKMMGYEPKEILNADYSTLVSFNIKSYLHLVEKRELLNDGTVKQVTKKAQTDKKTETVNKMKEMVISPMNDSENAKIISEKGVATKSAMLLCDNCPVSNKCLDYQEGSVCIRRKEYKELVKKYKSRDLAFLGEILTDILANQSERYNRGRDVEEISGIIDSDVTSLENSLFKNTKELVQLLTGGAGGPGAIHIDNININAQVGDAVGEISEQLTAEGRKDVAEEIGRILKERRYQAARVDEVAS